MDTAFLAQLISDLVLDNDSVTVPGLGEFVVKTVPSSFTDRGYTINPPYKTLIFTPREGTGNALAQLYAKIAGIMVREASEELLAFGHMLSGMLQSDGLVELPGLGKLIRHSGGLNVFIQDEDMDIFPGGIGFESISLRNQKPRQLSAASDQIPTPAAPDTEESPAAPESSPAAQDTEPSPASPEPSPVAQEIPSESAPHRRLSRKAKAAIITSAGIIVLVAIAIAAVAILGRCCPDFIDSILYDADQLQTIKKFGL